MAMVSFHSINRADAFDELAHVDGVPAGLRQLASTAIDQFPESELSVEFNSDVSESGAIHSVSVKILGPSRPMPVTFTRDQVVEMRGRMGTILKG